MKEKRELPNWAVGASIAVVVAFVAVLFAKGANGDASKDELMKIRNNQRSFASGSAPGAPAAGRVGSEPLGGPGAPPGAVVSPPGQG